MGRGSVRRLGAVVLALALVCGGCGGTIYVSPRPSASTPPAQTVSPAPPTAGVAAQPAEEPSPWAEPSLEPSAPAAPDATASEPPAVATPVPGYDYSQCVPQSQPVEEDFFADAAFIGDSRVDGFRLYSGLTQGDFMVKAGLSVFELDQEQVRFGSEKLTVLEALGRKTYAKVYVSLGINELGMYDDQGYYDHYAKLVDDIRALQPQADIYIQLLAPVNEKKCAQSKVAYYVTNEQIGIYNTLLRQLAADKQVFMVDPAQVLADETGQPPYDTVTDGVHFTRGTYAKWLEYLKCHTVQRGEDGSYEASVESPPDGGAVPEPVPEPGPDGLPEGAGPL